MRVRKLEERDLQNLSEVFREIYRDYSLHPVDSSELYKHFLETDSYDIYVLEDKDRLRGYVVLGVRDVGLPMIEIFEIVAIDRIGYNGLMEKVEEIASKKGAALINTSGFPECGVAEYLVDAGFLESRTVAAVAYLCDMQRILTLFVERAAKQDFHKDVTLLFVVGKERIRVKLPEGLMQIGEPDIEVVIGPNDLLSLLLKRSHCISLILKGKMKVKPHSRIMTVCAVIDYLSEDMKMVTPFAEFI
ncbi:MAG: hypothetical protein HXS44_08250 [Theionarchaea archaeon]|nr:hypothetical protein [Theionarchaea archaeon]